MTTIDNLLQDPQANEVLWDYCLEHDIPMPGVSTLMSPWVLLDMHAFSHKHISLSSSQYTWGGGTVVVSRSGKKSTFRSERGNIGVRYRRQSASIAGRFCTGYSKSQWGYLG